MIQNKIFGVLFFENIIPGIHNFIKQSTTRSLIILKNLERWKFVHRFQWRSPEFLFILDFLAKDSRPTKASEKDHSFYNKVSLIKPRSFHKAQLTWYCKKYAPTRQPKTFLNLQIFEQKSFWLVSKKNVCTTLISRRPRTAILEAFWKQMSVYFCNLSRKYLFQRCKKLLSG